LKAQYMPTPIVAIGIRDIKEQITIVRFICSFRAVIVLRILAVFFPTVVK
jgi:hypothetical protein